MKARDVLAVTSRLGMLTILLALSLPFCLSDVDCTVADTMHVSALTPNHVTDLCEISGALASQNSSVAIYDAPLSACNNIMTNSPIDVCYSVFRSGRIQMSPFFLNTPLVVVGGTVLALTLSGYLLWMLVHDSRNLFARPRR